MGKPRVTQVESTQKQELDPIAQGYLWSGQLPEEKLASLRRINEQVYGYAPGTLTPDNPTTEDVRGPRGFSDYGGAQDDRQQAAWEASTGYGPVQGPNQPGSGGLGGYSGVGDMFNGGGPGRSGDRFEGGGRLSDMGNAARDMRDAASGRGPEAQRLANGGIVALANGGMVPPMMGGRMPNLSNQDMAYQMAMQAMRRRPYAMGGYVEGPGTGTSDDIPAKIYQDGQPVQEAALSDGEFVMTERAVRGAGNGDPRAGAARMYEMMRKFERGGRVG